MKRRILMVLSLASILVFSLVGGAAPASAETLNLVANGDFETDGGSLTGWTVFVTDNGILNETVSENKTELYVQASHAATFRAGKASSDTTWQGGGIAQEFEAPAGGWVASFNLGVLDQSPDFYTDQNGVRHQIPAFRAPKVEFLVDDTVVSSFNPDMDDYLMHQRPGYVKLSASGRGHLIITEPRGL